MPDPLSKLIEMDEKDAVEAKRLAALNALSSAILEALPDGLVVVDLEGKIVLVNQKAVLLFGYTRAELIGRPVEDLIPSHLREIHLQHRLDYNSFDLNPHARTMGLGTQLTGVRKDGRQLPVDLQLARTVTPDGTYNIALVHYTPRPPASREKAADTVETQDHAGGE